jgi:hypothetical protein
LTCCVQRRQGRGRSALSTCSSRWWRRRPRTQPRTRGTRRWRPRCRRRCGGGARLRRAKRCVRSRLACHTAGQALTRSARLTHIAGARAVCIKAAAVLPAPRVPARLRAAWLSVRIRSMCRRAFQHGAHWCAAHVRVQRPAGRQRGAVLQARDGKRHLCARAARGSRGALAARFLPCHRGHGRPRRRGRPRARGARGGVGRAARAAGDVRSACCLRCLCRICLLLTSRDAVPVPIRHAELGHFGPLEAPAAVAQAALRVFAPLLVSAARL